jgi:CheY-like chemotaxis protein
LDGKFIPQIINKSDAKKSAASKRKDPANEISAQNEDWLRIFQSVVFNELRLELIWRIPLVATYCILVVLGAFIQGGSQHFALLYTGLGLSITALLFYVLVLKSRTQIQVYILLFTLAVLFQVAIFSCIFYLPMVFASPLCFGIVMWLLLIPWTWNFASVYILLALLMPFALPYDYLLCAAISLTLLLLNFIAFKVSSINTLTLRLRVASSFLSRFCNISEPSRQSVLIASRVIREVLSGRRAAVAFSNGELFTIRRDQSTLVDCDQLLVRTLLHKIEDKRKEEGWVFAKEFNEQFKGLWYDSFGYFPDKIIFHLLPSSSQNASERGVLLIPISTVLRLISTTQVFKTVNSLIAIIKIQLLSARTNTLSTDIMGSYEQILAEHEHEFSQMVHLVNNAAQDISIFCENARSRLDSLSPQAQRNAAIVDTVDLLEQIQMSNRSLAVNVSDMKLIRELLSVRSWGKEERVPLDRVISDLEGFAKYYAHNLREEINFEMNIPDLAGVRVVSSDYLDTVLRLLLRVSRRRIVPAGKVLCRFEVVGHSVHFHFYDTGSPVDPELKKVVLGEESLKKRSVEYDLYLRAVISFARVSGGDVTFLDGGDGYNNHTVLSLLSCTMSPTGVVSTGQWALLVDDNEEITTFYSRVAEALNLQFFTATSLSEAESILEREDRPRLVISDLQINGGSGLDLIKKVRARYGKDLPIIIVSGNNDENLINDVKKAGASKYLRKPVGRKRLFAEIEEIL